MTLTRIELNQFKNHHRFEFNPNIRWNAFVGLNGSGKTNALDGIYICCVLKSFLNHSMQDCVAFDQSFFRLVTVHDQQDEVIITYEKGGKRKIKWKGRSIQKPTDFIGKYPAMIIQPIDDYTLLAGSGARRKIIDGAISQFNRVYLSDVLRYKKLLRQRNALLKKMRTTNNTNTSELDILDQMMSDTALRMIPHRRAFVQSIKDGLHEYYLFLSGGQEIPDISYKPNTLESAYLYSLQQNQQVDLNAGRTTIGPHLDDIDMRLNGHKLKDIGSQGQRKSFLLALKLSIYQQMLMKSTHKPILLLDDLFDKLDINRVSRLIQLLNGPEFGQIFISEKDGDTINNLFDELNIDIHILELSV